MESLVVVQPFAEYAKGQIISDEEEMQSIITSDRSSYVVKINIDEAE